MINELKELADENGEIAYTSNTRSILDEALDLGLVSVVHGKFRQIEPGCLNSIYSLKLPDNQK